MAGPHNTIPPRGQIRALEQEKPKHNRRRRGNSCGQHQSQGQPTTQNDGFNTLAEQGNQQSGSGHPGGVRPPLPLLCSPLASVMVQNTFISQDARVADSSSAQRRPVSIAASPAGFPPSTSSRISGRRSDAATPDYPRSPRASSPPVTKFQGGMPATGACASSAAPLSQGTGSCALSAAPSATGARASGAAPLSYGIIQATGACASGAAPLGLGTVACAPGAAPASHAPRSSQTVAPARRSYQRGCLTPPPPGHAVAVGLRCGKADTEAPRSRVKLDSAFPRNSDGRSTLFHVKEEPTRLATSSPFSSRSAGSKPSPVDNLLPPTGAPLLKASTGFAGPLWPSRTLTHVRSAPSATAEQEKPDTARRASGDSTTSGQINRSVIPPKAEESLLSSSRTG